MNCVLGKELGRVIGQYSTLPLVYKKGEVGIVTSQ